MKITVFGATGRTGRPLVRQALDEGYEVRAFVRDPSKVEIEHENLELVRGNVQNAEDVERAVAGSDAVLSVLGHTPSSQDDILEVAARHIVAAMEKHGVRRLVTLTGAGVSDPRDEPKLWNKLMNSLLKLISGKVLEDSERHVEIVRNSDLSWVIVRVPMLTEGPHTGEYQVGYVGGDMSPRISRADVADFMLNQLHSGAYVHEAPVISGA